MLNILPTADSDVRDLCSLAMRCLVGREALLLDLIAKPRLDVPTVNYRRLCYEKKTNNILRSP